MEFFQSIATMELSTDLKILISPLKDGKLTVRVLLGDDRPNNSTTIILPPLRFTDSPAKLDEGFIATLTTPPAQATENFNNLESFIRQVDKMVKKQVQSKTEKPTIVQPVIKDPKRKKFDEQIAKVDALIAAGKFREAYGAIPKIKDFPQYKTEIEKKAKNLLSKFEPGLFASGPESSDNETPEETQNKLDAGIELLQEEEEDNETEEDEPDEDLSVDEEENEEQEQTEGPRKPLPGELFEA